MSHSELLARVFHSGPILAAVQSARLWPDSKTFVDCPAKVPLEEVLARFDTACVDVAAFVEDCFVQEAGAELQAHTPADWRPDVAWFASLSTQQARNLAAELHSRWALLCRVSKAPGDSDKLCSTLLPLPWPCFVPGDRFREVYYWDSLFIVRGLLAVEMTASAVGVASNLLHLASQHGFVPNGARSYYTNRSQPPVLAAVLQALDDAGVLDTSLRDAALPVLIAEWAFWTAPGTHGVRITASSSSGPREFRLSRYNANWTSPRPESWREDVATAAGLTTPGAKARVWRELATAAESGWDFSSRWCSPAAVAMAIQEGVDACDAHLLLRHTRCSRIVPADLNALLLILARCISKWARQVRDEPTGNAFAAHAQALAEAIHAVLWDPTGAQWRDFELTGFDDEGDIDSLATDNSSFIWTGRQSSREFASNWVPLWCGCLQPGSADALACCASLAASRLVQPGGIAASETATGQQWDWPNAWPPLQLLLAEGVARAGGPAGVALGKAMAGSYLRACVAGLAHQPVGAMHEKYDATVEATLDGGATCTRNAGGGGEYAPQVGFGWSNGVALAMLRTHGGIPDTTLSDVVAKMSK